jgi:hypothetical protein
MSLNAKASVVRPPVATSPAGTLIQELDIVLECGFDLAFLVVLDPGLPLIGDQPSSDEVVVVRIELKFAPPLSLEAIKEQGTLQNLRSEGTRASGHARCATIDTVSR